MILNFPRNHFDITLRAIPYAIDIPFHHAILVTKTGCKSFVN